MLQASLAGIAIALVVSGCVTKSQPIEVAPLAKPALSLSQQKAWALMVGRWYGDQPTTDGGKKQWIVERAADGTYRTNFRKIEANGKTEDSVEIGHWGVSGPVYFTSFRGWIVGAAFKPSDPSDPYNYDAYRIVQLNEQLFEYEDYPTGTKFVVRRIPPDFRLPE